MEQVAFSSLIASMLLIKREITSFELVNMMSNLEENEIFVDDEEDIDSISCCVDMNHNCSFRLKSNCSYDTVLSDGVKVRDFLKAHSSEIVNSFIENMNKINVSVSSELVCDSKKNKKKKRIMLLK